MVLNFGDKDKEAIWNGEQVRYLPVEIQKIGRRKLRMLNNSQNLIDLKIPPSNKLEELSGKFSEYYSIRINDKWRLMFKWIEGQSVNVSIVDYH
jgi:proteic killer suppression protein